MTAPGRDAVPVALVGLLSRWDDDAWAALTSRGLLRRARKDLATAEVVLLEADDDGVVVQVEGATVRVDAGGGPGGARCSCPSPVACRHVVLVGLWVAGLPGTASAEGQVSSEPSEGPAPRGEPASEAQVPPTDLRAELLALTTEELVAHAGRGGYRWARRTVDDLADTAVRVADDAYPVIGLPRPRVTFRYLGGGPGALVADVRASAHERHQVLAVLAYQRAHGVSLPTLEVVRRRAPTELDAGRARVLDAAAELLLDTVRLGLSHPSPGLHERYLGVSVWAQGVELYRLARLLRRLADHVERLLGRSGGVDEGDLLAEAALTWALVAALREATAEGADAPRRLVGTARNRYDRLATLDVVGLGSTTWRTPTGYHGLTTVLWWPDEQRVLTLTDARPVGLQGFDPRRRFVSGGPWTGLPSPSAAAGARLRVRDAEVSANGRLSGVDRTTVTLAALDGATLVASVPALDRWTDLPGTDVSPLDEPDRSREWVVVAPASAGAATFDPYRQELLWPLLDAAGDVLTVTVPYTAHSARLVTEVERCAAAGLPAGARVVGRLLPSTGRPVLDPLSLLLPDAPAGAAVHSFALAPRPSDDDDLGGGVPARPSPGVRGASGVAAGPVTPSDTVPTVLRDVRSLLVRVAERGISGAGPGRAELARAVERARAAGLDVLRPPGDDGDGAADILVWTYTVDLLARILTGAAPLLR